MYEYRKMTPEERAEAVRIRQLRGYPWHGPPHLGDETRYRIVTAACYEHRPVLNTVERLAWFEQQLLETVAGVEVDCVAWVVLPNHYHVLVELGDAKRFATELGKLHGRTSHQMNVEDNTPGRKVWYRCQDRYMRSDRHFHVSRNYIHHNPVRHRWSDQWQEWPFSSVHWYLEEKGRKWLLDEWREYPLKEYGAKWDVFGATVNGTGIERTSPLKGELQACFVPLADGTASE